MQNKPQDIGEIHQKFEAVVDETKEYPSQLRQKIKCPYEFFTSVDRGWVPCDVVEADTTNELIKVVYPHPDGDGWSDITGAAGIFEEVVEMWRVRLRES